MITRSKINAMSDQELSHLLLKVEPKEIRFVCNSKNSRIREICNSDFFKMEYEKVWNLNVGDKRMKEQEGQDISDYTVEQLQEVTKGKIIFLFSGCFCPPHAGHYNIVEKVISQLIDMNIKPDIVVIQSTNNDDYPRHGVPLSHTLKTWRDWGQLLSRKYGVNMYISGMWDNNISWRGASPETKMVVDVSIHENNIPYDLINKLEKKDNMSLSYFQYVPRDRLYKFHAERTGHLSATKFTECLKDLTKNCEEYVPEGVDKKSYINNIREKYFNELK